MTAFTTPAIEPVQRSRHTAVDLGRIHQQCARVERSLRSPLNDEVELLRTARVLRRIHENLRGALIVQARVNGWNENAIAIQTVLDRMEGELRAALLGYPQVRGLELRGHVEEAFQRSLDAVDLLSASS